MDNKVNFLRGTATEYEASTKDNDTFYYTTDDEKLYLGNKEITGGSVTIDDTLSDTSKNPVQNKVINAALNSKANLSDIPTTLPANGGNADTVDGKHADDFALSTNPTIEGEIHLARSGNATTSSTLFAWEDTARIRNTDTSAKNLTYTDLVITPNGIYTEAIQDGAIISRTKINDNGNADTLDGKHASDFALKTDIPTTLPANGGTANAARETVSPNAKAKLWEDSEGGNLRLVSPDGHHYAEMDIFNNESFRMCFVGESGVIQALTYNFTTKKLDINGNAATVNGHTVNTNVPANAKFTDTTYGNASASAPGLVSTGAQTLAGNKTFNGQVIPAGASAVGTAQARKIYAGTSDMTAGTTALETGAIYLVYE